MLPTPEAAEKTKPRQKTKRPTFKVASVGYLGRDDITSPFFNTKQQKLDFMVSARATTSTTEALHNSAGLITDCDSDAILLEPHLHTKAEMG